MASLINLFLKPGPLDTVIASISVFLFTRLTAWNAQVVRPRGQRPRRDAGHLRALSLYITFINLFLMLLRLFGGGGDRR